MTDRDLFIAALDHADPAERDAWLDQACAGDPERRRRVDVLLRAHDQASKFLADPAMEQLGRAPDDPTRTAHPADETIPTADVDVRALLAPTDKPGLLGKLDHYEVLDIVGTGGMGVVLKAFDPTLHRLVAVKLLAPHLAAHAAARQRFAREARANAAVRNEHVVAIHSVQADGPSPYLVMEFVGGVSLQDRLERSGALDVKEILRIGMQTARGLAAAHSQGLVHRDVKPANILLENGVERVKLTDFGLARAADDANLTRSGVIIGTPNYMSPEQAAGSPVDARADLFSLGSVLYALCTGHPPFRAETPLAVLRRVADDPVRSIREINPDTPDWLDAIIRKLLAKNPADRFPSANEVADLLGRHLAHLQQPGAAPMPEPVELPGAHEVPTALTKMTSDGSGAAPTLAGLGCLVGLVGLVGLTLTAVFAEAFFKGFFRPGYVAPVYMLTVSGLLVLLMWWARRRSKPGWDRHWFDLAIAAIAAGTVIGLLASWVEEGHLGRMSRALNLHTLGLVLGCLFVTVPNLIKAVRWLATRRRVEVRDGPSPVAGSPPDRDHLTASVFTAGILTFLVGVVLIALYERFAIGPSRTKGLLGLMIGASLVTLLLFGVGIFLSRRRWHRLYGPDRRGDRRAFVLSGIGIGLTLMAMVLNVARHPPLRAYVLGLPAEPRLMIHWDPQRVDRVTVERDQAVFHEFAGRERGVGLPLPPATYTVRGWRDGAEVYQETLTLGQTNRHGISMFEPPHPGSDYGLLQVTCEYPMEVVSIIGPNQIVTMNDRGARRSVISQPLWPANKYRFVIARGKNVLHDETLQLKTGEQRDMFIPRIGLPEKTVSLKPKSGSFPTDVTKMLISPDRSLVAVGRLAGPIVVFDAATGEERFTINRPASDNTAFAFTPNSSLIGYVGPVDGRTEHVVQFVSTRSGDHTPERLKLKTHQLMNSHAIAFSADSRRGAVSSAYTFGPDNQFRSRIGRWDNPHRMPESTAVSAFEWQDGTIQAMKFNPDGPELLAITDAPSGVAVAWKWETGEQTRVAKTMFVTLDLLATGKTLDIIGGWDEKLNRPALWSWRRSSDRENDAWAEPLPFRPGSIRLASLAVSDDGKTVAVATKGGDKVAWEQRAVIRLFDPKAERDRAILLGHTDWPLDLAFTSDGKNLVSTGKDGTVRFWKLP